MCDATLHDTRQSIGDVALLGSVGPRAPTTLSSRSPAAMAQRLTLGDREITVIQRLKKILALPVTKIARAVGRNKSTVYKALSTEPGQRPRRGRPELLSKRDVDKLVKVVRALVKKAGARLEVTLAMVRRSARVKTSEHCIRTALQ